MNTVRQQRKERMMKHEHIPLSLVRIMARGIILVAVLLSGMLFPLVQEGLAKTIHLTVVHTNNVNGHLFACPT
ncbi:MAG: hypothetical protein MUO24_02560 [Desulfobacterales bacterium]|nr:hypothetical protein [Desulfobacterales bacterium]